MKESESKSLFLLIFVRFKAGGFYTDSGDKAHTRVKPQTLKETYGKSRKLEHAKQETLQRGLQVQASSAATVGDLSELLQCVMEGQRSRGTEHAQCSIQCI